MSVLSREAEALLPGKLTTLGDAGWSYDPAYGIQWGNRFFYDAARQKAVLISKSEGGAPYWVNVYDEASNAWTPTQWSLGNNAEFGHPYESLGYDPVGAHVYTGIFTSNRLKRVAPFSSPGSWERPYGTACPVSPSQDIQTALAWHPNLYGTGDGGVVMQTGAQTYNGAVYAWRAGTDSWQQVSGVAWTASNAAAYNGALVYNPGDDCVWIATQSSDRKLFRLTAGSGGSLGTATEIGTTPVLCGYDSSSEGIRGILVPDPANGTSPYILEKGGTNRIWKWSGSAWTLKVYTHPLPYGSVTTNRRWMVASCAPLGVFMARGSDRNLQTSIWKPND